MEKNGCRPEDGAPGIGKVVSSLLPPPLAPPPPTRAIQAMRQNTPTVKGAKRRYAV